MQTRIARFKCLVALLFATITLATSPSIAAPVFYDYVGNPFATATSPYTTTNRVSGWVEFSSALTPGATLNDPAVPVAFSLSDGVRTLTQANTTAGRTYFYFATSPAGDITDWVVHAEYQFNVAGGGEVQIVETANDRFGNFFPSGPEIFDYAETTLCGSDSSEFGCSSGGTGYASGAGTVSNNAGVWTMRDSAIDVPEPPILALVVIAFAGLRISREGFRKSKRLVA